MKANKHVRSRRMSRNTFASPNAVARALIRMGRRIGKRHQLSRYDTDSMIYAVAAAIGQARLPL